MALGLFIFSATARAQECVIHEDMHRVYDARPAVGASNALQLTVGGR